MVAGHVFVVVFRCSVKRAVAAATAAAPYGYESCTASHV